MIEYCRLNIEDLMFAYGGSIIKKIDSWVCAEIRYREMSVDFWRGGP